MKRLLKGIAIAITSVIVLLVLAAVGLWIWAGTQSSLDWTLERIARSQSIKAEGVEGSLRTGLKAKHIQWEKEGLKVEAFDADLAWQPLAIARATVKLDRLHAARLRIEDTRPPKPKEIPTNLTLPMRVEVDDVRVAQLQWVTPQQQVEVTDVAGDYTFNALSHKAKLASAKWMGGSFSGEGSLNAGGTMAIDAKLQGEIATAVPGSQKSAPLAFTVTASGKLPEIQVRAQARGTPDSPTAGAVVDATARVMPFQDQPVPEVDASRSEACFASQMS